LTIRAASTPTPRAFARALALVALVLASALGGCGAPPVEPDPMVRAQALIEAGNRAYKSGDYGLAARRYAAAAVVRDDDPAAYFGLGMALARLGRDEEARAAYTRARELARQQAAAPPPPVAPDTLAPPS
jgi:tetratricopeptide (TPR) repeat protein